VRFTPRRYYTPQTEADVIEILDRHAGEHIRVVGSRHAWSEAIVSPDIIVNVRHLNHLEITETPSGETWATVGGGCQISRLLAELHARSGATLPSIGLITERPIAKAITTTRTAIARKSITLKREKMELRRSICILLSLSDRVISGITAAGRLCIESICRLKDRRRLNCCKVRAAAVALGARPALIGSLRNDDA